MRIAVTLVASLAAVLAIAPVADAGAMDDIATANQKGQVVFLVVTQAGARNLEAARSAANEAQKQVKGSAVVELDRADASQAAAVKRYKLQAAPVPVVLVIAPNGVAAGASLPGKGATKRLVDLVPTPKKADHIQAIEQRQTSIIVFSRPTMQEQSKLFENLSAVTREMKDKVRLVLVDLDDVAEKNFITEWDVPMKSVRPTIAVVNAKGQPLGRMVGLQSADEIIKTCKQRAPCCSDPNCKGCK
jgi:hypothetical protein